MTDDALLTAAQVATELAISPRAVYDLARGQRIAHYRFGKAIRFAPADVAAFKEASRVEVRGPRAPRAPLPVKRHPVSNPQEESELYKAFARMGITPRLKPPGK